MLRIREPNWYEYRMINKPDSQPARVLVWLPGIDRIPLFRDWLRRNAAERDLYARTKLALAEREWKYVQNKASQLPFVALELT